MLLNFPRPALWLLPALLIGTVPAEANQVLCTECAGIPDCVPVCWEFDADRSNDQAKAGLREPAAPLHWQDPQVQKGGASGPLPDAGLRQLIQRLATEARMDPALVHAVIRAESGFNRYARSHKGAEGLMQLMPGTAREMGVSNSFVAEQNIRGGIGYLQRMLELFDGNTRLALAAYNAGPEVVLSYGGVPPFRETQQYVTRVLRYRDELRLAAKSE